MWMTAGQSVFGSFSSIHCRGHQRTLLCVLALFALATGAKANQVATPTFSPVAGTYTSAQTVSISTTTSAASIRYTTDGSTPSHTVGTLYSGPITVSSTTTLKAIAYKNGWTDSTIASGTYTITGTVANPGFSP